VPKKKRRQYFVIVTAEGFVRTALHRVVTLCHAFCYLVASKDIAAKKDLEAPVQLSAIAYTIVIIITIIIIILSSGIRPTMATSDVGLFVAPFSCSLI